MAEVTSIPDQPIPAQAQSAMVSMRDGVRLATDIYLPGGASEGLPTILVRMPYDKCGEYCFMPRIEEAFTDVGYAFVVQDVRGRTRSEGETFPFVHEVADGYDTLDWIAAQPWSNGDVGMIGDSYYGFTSWCAAAGGHPALKAIAPRVTAANLGMATEPQGDDTETFALRAWLPWLLYVWIDHGAYEAEFDWSVRPLRDAFAIATGGRRSTGYEALLRRPLSDPWWMRSIYGSQDPHEVVDIPVLHWAGWWDNCQYGQFRSYRRMCSRPEVRHRQYLIADAVDHEGFSWEEAPRRRSTSGSSRKMHTAHPRTRSYRASSSTACRCRSSIASCGGSRGRRFRACAGCWPAKAGARLSRGPRRSRAMWSSICGERRPSAASIAADSRRSPRLSRSASRGCTTPTIWCPIRSSTNGSLWGPVFPTNVSSKTASMCSPSPVTR